MFKPIVRKVHESFLWLIAFSHRDHRRVSRRWRLPRIVLLGRGWTLGTTLGLRRVPMPCPLWLVWLTEINTTMRYLRTKLSSIKDAALVLEQSLGAAA